MRKVRARRVARRDLASARIARAPVSGTATTITAAQRPTPAPRLRFYHPSKQGAAAAVQSLDRDPRISAPATSNAARESRVHPVPPMRTAGGRLAATTARTAVSAPTKFGQTKTVLRANLNVKRVVFINQSSCLRRLRLFFFSPPPSSSTPTVCCSPPLAS